MLTVYGCIESWIGRQEDMIVKEKKLYKKLQEDSIRESLNHNSWVKFRIGKE